MNFSQKCVFGKNSLRSLRSRGLFEVAEARLWISSIFYSFHLEFLLFWVSRSKNSVTSEGAQAIFSKITFLKSGRSNKKDEVCHSFLVKFFTKYLHRRGVGILLGDKNATSLSFNIISTLTLKPTLKFFQLLTTVSLSLVPSL